MREVFDQVIRAAHSEQITNFSIPQARRREALLQDGDRQLCHVESIRGITLNIRDISDATRLHDQLRTLAFHDSLTLLANRSLFSDRVHQAIRHIADGMTPAVLFIDLDNFKTVNDSLGHSAGDPLLRAFAHRLVQCTRAGDTVARLGGDEFAVLIDHAPDVDAAMAVARQVLDTCRSLSTSTAARCASAAASASRSPIASATWSDCCAMPMRPCTRPSRAARATPKMFEPEMLRAARRRMRIENELATAIDSAAARGALPADRRSAVAPPRGRRGADALAPSDARSGDAGGFHPARRGDRADRADDAVDAESRLRGPGAPAARDRARRGLRVSVNVSSRYLNHGNIVDDVRNGARRRTGSSPTA